MVDIVVENHGSIFLFRPMTPDGREFLGSEFPSGDDCQYFGGALVVEPRYAQDIARCLMDAGLVLE